MSLQEQIKEMREKIASYFTQTKTQMTRLVRPETAEGLKRLQTLRLIGTVSCITLLAYGSLFLFFHQPRDSKSSQIIGKKPEPTQIESGASNSEKETAWRYNMDTAIKNLSDTVRGMASAFEASIKARNAEEQTRLQALEERFSEFKETVLEQVRGHGTQGTVHNGPSDFSQSQGSEQEADKPSIQKVTLSLSENSKNRKAHTVDTTIPAGAFAKTVLLSGLDASASMNASSDPRPMLLRLIDYGTLPRRFQSNLKDCHCTASAFGDLSSERIYARLEKLTCIEQKTGEIIETQVAGYIAGSDGKAGIRGIVASKDGQLLARSLVGGVFAGLSNVANPQQRQSMANPFFPGVGAGASKIAAPTLGETFGAGMASGASSALDRLSQYYIDRAEQLQPVIQVAAGQVVDIVFTEGTFIGSQSAHLDARSHQSPGVNNQSNQKGQ